MTQNNFAKDYIDVATRIVEFRNQFPNGSLQKVSMEFVNVGGRDWVVYTAAAYRGPDDLLPGIGTAWEPIPGLTPYTKNSEVMVAETSAWGRAMVAALAVDTKQGIASANEVLNRRSSEEKTPRMVQVANDWGAQLEDASSREELLDLFNKARAAKASKATLDAITAKGKTLG